MMQEPNSSAPVGRGPKNLLCTCAISVEVKKNNLSISIFVIEPTLKA